MRWFWIDRFVEFVSGDRAASVKNVVLAEEAVDDYFPGFPHFPQSLMIEGVAQTGGLLIAETSGFEQRVVLAKISSARFESIVRPGQQIRYEVQVQDLQPAGAIVTASVQCDQQPIGSFELAFAILGDRFGSVPLFAPSELLRCIRLLRLYDVGVDKLGNRLTPSPYLLGQRTDGSRMLPEEE